MPGAQGSLVRPAISTRTGLKPLFQVRLTYWFAATKSIHQCQASAMRGARGLAFKGCNVVCLAANELVHVLRQLCIENKPVLIICRDQRMNQFRERKGSACTTKFHFALPTVPYGSIIKALPNTMEQGTGGTA